MRDYITRVKAGDIVPGDLLLGAYDNEIFIVIAIVKRNQYSTIYYYTPRQDSTSFMCSVDEPLRVITFYKRE